MPLGGSGSALGNVLASAVGAPSSVGSFFALLGGAIAEWAPQNIQVNPGSMAAASGAVSGTGSFSVVGEASELGNLMADRLTIPADAADARAVWVAFAQAIIDQFENFGVANGTGLTSGSPCGGAGTISFSVAAFVPPLASSLTVADAIAAALLEAFGAMLLSFIQTNGTVVGLSLSGPPLSAPTDGPCTGTGTIA